jgi:hypothetical protein
VEALTISILTVLFLIGIGVLERRIPGLRKGVHEFSLNHHQPED